jgi:hypothetical protein
MELGMLLWATGLVLIATVMAWWVTMRMTATVDYHVHEMRRHRKFNVEHLQVEQELALHLAQTIEAGLANRPEHVEDTARYLANMRTRIEGMIKVPG